MRSLHKPLLFYANRNHSDNRTYTKAIPYIISNTIRGIQLAYEEFRQKIVNLQSDVNLFKAEFLDRDKFKKFADNLRTNVHQWHNIRITGYFSETIRQSLESLITVPAYNIRLICPHLNIKQVRDKKNFQALGKLASKGVEIKFNDRLHARFLVAYNLIGKPIKEYRGLLLIGSFDFNTECIGRERYDAGIMTRNPDLVESAVKLFEQIWNEPESKPLKDYEP